MEYFFSYDATVFNDPNDFSKGTRPIHVVLDLITTDPALPTDSVTILSISGTWNGQTVTGLSPVGGYGGNDNVFYPNDNSVDGDGVGYSSNSGFTFTVSTIATAAQPNPIAGDDGASDVNFFNNGTDDGEYTDGLTAPATNETLTPACYCRGTRIRTASGDRPIEEVSIGDIVVTASGAFSPIRWIGRRSYAGRFLAANPSVQPIRFGAGSLGAGLPVQDLLVSPEHAMFIDGVLVPARCLVDGVMITHVRGLSRVDYLHIELDQHDIVIAEGVPSETFLDDDSRGRFHNAAEYRGVAPDGTARVFCAPKVEGGDQLDGIRRRLAGRVVAAAA